MRTEIFIRIPNDCDRSEEPKKRIHTLRKFKEKNIAHMYTHVYGTDA